MNNRITHPETTPFPSSLLQSQLFHWALIVILGVAAYGNTFHVPFQFDDYHRMLELPYVQDLRYLTDWSVAQHYAVDHEFRVRFIGYLSFALNYAIHGDDVVGYHVVNLAIHLMTAILVYYLVRLTLRTPYFRDRPLVTGLRPLKGFCPQAGHWSLYSPPSSSSPTRSRLRL